MSCLMREAMLLRMGGVGFAAMSYRGQNGLEAQQ